LEEMAANDQLLDFLKARRQFEDFLIAHQEALGMIVHRYGSGGRHIPWVHEYYKRVATGLWGGKTADDIWAELGRTDAFSMLANPPGSRLRGIGRNDSGDFADSTKTASYWSAALPGAVRCHLCQGLIHTNSVQTDHLTPRAKGGSVDMKNAHPAHPYCNSIKGEL
jgi:5-methylcytosine-specific restriction endonuclease McrA